MSNIEDASDKLAEILENNTDHIGISEQTANPGETIKINAIGRRSGVINAVAATRIDTGAQVAVLQTSKGALAIQETEDKTNSQNVINDSWVREEKENKKPPTEKPGKLKILFSRQTGSLLEFFIGGDRETPFKIYSIDIKQFEFDIVGDYYDYTDMFDAEGHTVGREFTKKSTRVLFHIPDYHTQNVVKYDPIFVNYPSHNQPFNPFTLTGARGSNTLFKCGLTNLGKKHHEFIVSLHFFNLKTVLVKGDLEKGVIVKEYDYKEEFMNDPFLLEEFNLSNEKLLRQCSTDIGSGNLLSSKINDFILRGLMRDIGEIGNSGWSIRFSGLNLKIPKGFDTLVYPGTTLWFPPSTGWGWIKQVYKRDSFDWDLRILTNWYWLPGTSLGYATPLESFDIFRLKGGCHVNWFGEYAPQLGYQSVQVRKQTVTNSHNYDPPKQFDFFTWHTNLNEELEINITPKIKIKDKRKQAYDEKVRVINSYRVDYQVPDRVTKEVTQTFCLSTTNLEDRLELVFKRDYKHKEFYFPSWAYEGYEEITLNLIANGKTFEINKVKLRRSEEVYSYKNKISAKKSYVTKKDYKEGLGLLLGDWGLLNNSAENPVPERVNNLQYNVYFLDYPNSMAKKYHGITCSHNSKSYNKPLNRLFAWEEGVFITPEYFTLSNFPTRNQLEPNTELVNGINNGNLIKTTYYKENFIIGSNFDIIVQDPTKINQDLSYNSEYNIYYNSSIRVGYHDWGYLEESKEVEAHEYLNSEEIRRPRVDYRTETGDVWIWAFDLRLKKRKPDIKIKVNSLKFDEHPDCINTVLRTSYYPG